jgi:hypothetical protein
MTYTSILAFGTNMISTLISNTVPILPYNRNNYWEVVQNPVKKRI